MCCLRDTTSQCRVESPRGEESPLTIMERRCPLFVIGCRDSPLEISVSRFPRSQRRRPPSLAIGLFVSLHRRTHLPQLSATYHPQPTMITKRIVQASSSLPRNVRSLATAVATDPSSSTSASTSTSARRFPKLDDGLTLADFASGEPLEDRVTLGNTQQ